MSRDYRTRVPIFSPNYSSRLLRTARTLDHHQPSVVVNLPARSRDPPRPSLLSPSITPDINDDLDHTPTNDLDHPTNDLDDTPTNDLDHGRVSHYSTSSSTSPRRAVRKTVSSMAAIERLRETSGVPNNSELSQRDAAVFFSIIFGALILACAGEIEFVDNLAARGRRKRLDDCIHGAEDN